MQIIRQSSFRTVPWKNGGGVTHEALRVPASGDPFRWRVSVARLDTSGPFSDFADYRRSMVLLRGQGVRLKFSNGEARELGGVGDMAEFDGGLATSCELADGPCVDLNFMAHKSLDGARAHIERVHRPFPLASHRHRWTLVFPIDAPLQVHAGSNTAVLEPWDLAVVTDSENGPVSLVHREPFEAATVFIARVPEA
jgi:environmental stress-induced protein Ves